VQNFRIWFEIPVENGPDYTARALVGPDDVAVGDEPIITIDEGAWVGTRQTG
jgi:hypothetical protein